MNPRAEREIVQELAEVAEHWRVAPMYADAGVVAVSDQIAARIADELDRTGMTESERLTFGLGFLAASRQLHGQIEDWDLHDGDGLAICESIGLISGVVARKVIEPPRKEG